jgi:hypothetical protein
MEMIVRLGGTMPELLKEAYAAIAELPESDQEAIASLILEELASERRWQQAFDRSADGLAKLADEALTEYRAGQTQPLDPDRL